MEVAIVGLPLAGKTTIFNALTGSRAETGSHGSGRSQIATAVVDIPDARVDRLSAMFNPRKTTRARIQFNDISGISRGNAEAKGLDVQMLAAIGKCDALLEVVRAFDNPQAPHPEGSIDPARDLEALRLEFQISDLAMVERRRERIEAGFKKTKIENRALLLKEQAMMERFQAVLEAEGLLVDVPLDDEERTILRGFQFLTVMPALVVVNLGEDDEPGDLAWAGQHAATALLPLRGSLEMEIAQLPDEERSVFLAEYGIAEPGLNAMVRTCYDLLGVMSFFTVGEDEVRAWTVRRDATAVEAAGAIHSDLARGFIRAEVLSYEDMMACGTMAEARKRGKLRLEGRDYVVQDGDILNIRFNV
jgi:GTP-binding protein YchF